MCLMYCFLNRNNGLQKESSSIQKFLIQRLNTPLHVRLSDTKYHEALFENHQSIQNIQNILHVL